MFHPDYKYITDKFPTSLVRRTLEPLVPLELISGKSDRIESYSRHTLDVYEKIIKQETTQQIYGSKKIITFGRCFITLLKLLMFICDHEKEITVE